MPISGFKPGDIVLTPAGRKAEVLSAFSPGSSSATFTLSRLPIDPGCGSLGSSRVERRSTRQRSIRDDKKLVVIAAAQAQKAADLVLGTEFGEKKEEAAAPVAA